LRPGTVRVRVRPSAEFLPVGLSWADAGLPGTAPVAARITSWTSTDRTVEVAASHVTRTLELAENANSGWTASLDGEQLSSVRVDGWRQAWVVPAGASGTVAITYTPDTAYRALLALGLVAALVLLVLALVPGRGNWEPAGSEVRLTSRGRTVATLIVGALSIGVVGAGAAWVALRFAAAGVRRPWIAAAGTVVATTAAVIAPWPLSTSWSGSLPVAAALVVSAGTGLVLGALIAPDPDSVGTDPPLRPTGPEHTVKA
jgi:arabinofuranan 3-O-arabinosyltransferase